ncbi:hypothetical protein GH5_04871 [Leishmania sp. Ghana 2012 LV757]|uniref:hypothetical protein n=1 Tax=Leishmania sp. Ghana 2012 LV757 TaxID=2803181 RepID=UPI001B60B679|nr:hypothetical protein GH5_04871 [Leishmania sp. Ghana 2012 LV757]
MNLSAAPQDTTAAPPHVPRKGLTPPRRSGITRLSTPHYASATATASARPPLFTSVSSLAHAAVSTDTSPTATVHLNTRDWTISTPHAPRYASARRASRSPSPQALDPYPASIRNPAPHGHTRPSCTTSANGSTGGNISSSASWRRHAAAPGRRLKHTAQEAEQILMPITASTAATSPSMPLDDNGGGGRTCTLAQAMEAVQRHRSGCMAAMPERGALQQRLLSVSSASTPTRETDSPAFLCSPIPSVHRRTASEGDDGGTPTSSLGDAAQLHHRYRLMKARLADTVAAQSAYMYELLLQQQLREREGVMGEYMWSTRLLVEQEAAERAHLISLWAYFIASASERRTAPKAGAGTGPIYSAAARTLHTPAATSLSQLSTHDSATASRVAAQSEVLLQDLHGANVRAQESAVAQLTARHDAETTALESRLRAALEEAARSQRCLTEVKRELAAAQSATCETQRCAGVTYDGLHQQLKDTTKKMWQLQLANDHLDAKARVLERELEELRLSCSLMRGCRGGGETASAAAEEANGSVSLSPIGAAFSSNGCAGNHSGGPKGGNPQLVNPGVWVAYEQRSSLWGSTTPRKQLSLASSPSSVRALTAARWTREPQRRDSTPRSPIINLTHTQGSSLVAASATSTTTGTGVNASHMSEDSAVHVFTANTHQRKPPPVAGAVRAGDNGSASSNQQQPFERTMSPACQLSLGRSPVTRPSVSATLSHGRPRQGVEGAEPHPEDVKVAVTDKKLDSVTHDDSSREQQNAATTSPNASAQAEVSMSLRSATPPLPVTLAAVSTRSPAPSTTTCSRRYSPRLTAVHDVRSMASDQGTESETDDVVAQGGDKGGLQSSLVSLCSSPTACGSRARLETLRRDILRHVERLEQEVQVVTSRYDAARRQRRRERDTLRVNASVHSASNSPATSEPRDDGGRYASSVNADTEALDRALEVLHIEQQEDDDELERYYADVNQKRTTLKRCLLLVDDKLSVLS